MKNSQTAFLSVLITLLVILLPIGAVFAANYSLIMHAPEIKEVSRPDMKMLYIEHTGSYRKGPTFIVEIFQMAAKNKIACQELLGLYYNSFVVDEDKRYSRYGCVVDAFPEVTPEGYKQMTIPASEYVMAVRRQQGPIVNIIYGQRLSQYAQNHGLIGNADFGFIEMYTPARLQRGTAEMYLPVIKRPD